MDLSAFYNQFRDETSENVRLINASLLALEQLSDAAQRRAQLDTLFRAVHTIKGAARMLGFSDLGNLAHAMENTLGALRHGERTFDQQLADRLLRGSDALLALAEASVVGDAPPIDIAALIAQFAATESALAPLPGGTAEPPLNRGVEPSSRGGRAQTVRVRVDRLDRLINLAGELVIGQQTIEEQRARIATLERIGQQQRRALKALDAELRRLRFSPLQRRSLDQHLAALFNTDDHMNTALQHQASALQRFDTRQSQLLKDLEQEVMGARMLPIATVFTALPRAVRDLAQATGKEVVLTVQGETTELDRKVLELISDPLLHLLRNAVDHGIEPPTERTAAAKPAVGHITLRAEASGGEVRITIEDDGRGLDPQQLRATAVRRGLLSAEQAALLDDAQTTELIFAPGFSTATLITDISGRGVGMDVVRNNILELGGQVQIDSRPGLGTRVTLLLPLTLVTTRVLLVRAGNATLALPSSGCRGTIWIYRERLRTLEGQTVIEHNAQTIAVFSLAELLRLSGEPVYTRAARTRAVLVGNIRSPIALIVDQLVDEREAVVKALGPIFQQHRLLNGAIQLGDGSLVLLLNPHQLAREVGSSVQRSITHHTAPRRAPHLLVADDSFTTRELIKSILQSAGYSITVATDGVDALDKLQRDTYDLVVSDVEMPRLNGFELTSRIRQESALHTLPVILVTSLPSDDHRRQGLEAGAQAYIVKSQFDQDNLLDTIQQLLGHEG